MVTGTSACIQFHCLAALKYRTGFRTLGPWMAREPQASGYMLMIRLLEVSGLFWQRRDSAWVNYTPVLLA